MPTYDYKCNDCGHEFETYQSMKDDKLTVCPNCGKNALVRLIGAGGGLIFKGSGFYLTDYKNKPAETTTGKSTPSESKKTETAPAAADTSKTDTKTTKETSVKQSEKKESKPKTQDK